MKLLVVLLVVLFGVWLWRRGRAVAAPERSARPAAAPQSMICCARCGVHVPSGTAIAGRAGDYCCAAHRQEAEGG